VASIRSQGFCLSVLKYIFCFFAVLGYCVTSLLQGLLMAKNVVSLTVHRNTLSKRRGRNTANTLKMLAEGERKQGDTAGFVLVTWNADKTYSCYIHCPEYSPVSVNDARGFVDSAVIRAIAEIDRDC